MCPDINLDAGKRCVEIIEEKGRRGLSVQSDVTKEKDCKDLVETVLNAYGSVDILVNNAGHFGEQLGLPFTNQTEAGLGRQLCRQRQGSVFPLQSRSAAYDGTEVWEDNQHILHRGKAGPTSFASLCGSEKRPFEPDTIGSQGSRSPQYQCECGLSGA